MAQHDTARAYQSKLAVLVVSCLLAGCAGTKTTPSGLDTSSAPAPTGAPMVVAGPVPTPSAVAGVLPTQTPVPARTTVPARTLVPAESAVPARTTVPARTLAAPPAAQATPESSVTPAPTGTSPPTPTGTPEAPPSRTPVPTPTPTVYAYLPARPGPLRVNAFATVLADDLVLRSYPYVSGDSEILTPHLRRGNRLFVLEGPVTGSGYDWYEVHPMPPDSDADLPSIGWVAAASREGALWIEGLVVDCPPLPVTFGTLGTLWATEQIACYRGLTLSFEARLVGETATIDWLPIQTPERFWAISLPADSGMRTWLFLGDPAGPANRAPLLTSLPLRVATPGLAPSTLNGQPLVRVEGHVDDPASTACRDEYGWVTDAEAVLMCRGDFIVTSLTVPQ